MELLVLGTGGTRGWPEAGCGCASCRTASVLRSSRAPTCVLLDDVLLLDGGADVAAAAARSGRSLTGVRHVLLSGVAEADATPLAPLLRTASAAAPVDLLGPAGALQPYRDLLSQHVRLHPLSPGDVVPAGEHVLHALEHRDGLAYDVSCPDGTRLLYAAGAAALPGRTVDALRGARHDVALLAIDDAEDRDALPRTLAALRAASCVVETTDVIAAGLGHRGPLPDERERHLQAWGARAVDDGTHLVVPQAPHDTSGLSGRTLVLGGARSGKSALAEQLLAAHPHVDYVATGGLRDDDAEWSARVAAHVARRPGSWRTRETTDVADCLRSAQRPLLIDCLGTWLTARLDAHGVWDGAPASGIDPDIEELVAAWRAATVPVVAVSNEVGSGVVPATASGRLFRDLLGRLNARVAAESETVLLTVAGMTLPLRSLPPVHRGASPP